MIKKIKYFIFFSIFLIFSNCSFDTKTGIWDGGPEEEERAIQFERKQKQVIEVIKIYSAESVKLTEVKATKNVSLSEPIKNESWETSNLNIQNSTGNLYLSSTENNFLKKKVGKNKFSISRITTSPIIYNDIIFFFG